MGSSNISPSLKTSPYTNRQAQLPSISSLTHGSPWDGHSTLVGSKSIEQPTELLSHHLRCSSESCLVEQPYWLDDLLNEPETLVQKGHRRSVSDSSTYLCLEANPDDINEETNFTIAIAGPASWGCQALIHQMDPLHASFEKRPSSSDKEWNIVSEPLPMVSEGLMSTAARKPDQVDSVSRNQSGLQLKPFLSKSEAKRAKQQSAHRSRVKKLQYIAELERTVEALQAEGCAVSAELEFLDQHNLILGMENRTLRQRLDNLSQEQAIKQMEQEMLQREIARLQTLYHLQLLQHQQQHEQEHSRPRRNRSQDLDTEFANLSINK
ncbi:uncharacterized protein At4g06598-like isoform X2 [Rhododendron vialii]|uniref:uncharacterized protein At4g06598-like isoform X1 n=1 Tax=Rhododendron vialii TaxID=182163 RepID=UPI00265FFECD|nr:uncharacterized protein At4g06598-like isoform X1 [Rhododendron vialii]XP_058224997.1 uncharacterized protein At4g06598-like isoform X2 [Rhododendron vialii]